MKVINKLKENYPLLIILFIASILRLYHVDYQSLWLDEIHTINEANPKLSWSELYNSLLVSDPHPPLYFVLVQQFLNALGYSSFVLRLFSALVGIWGVYAIYLLAKEIFNKKAGIYAALLVTINYFHIYYSQEGRMYSLLFLMTAFSFYYFIRFIKRPTLRTALIYAIFSTLMIYCHFFALFALCSQYLILLFFIIKPFKATSKRFFSYCCIAWVTTLFLYLPVYKIFKKTTEITSIWIQMPTLDVYTQFFKDFFGQSEIVLFFIVLLLFLFFFHLFKTENTEKLRLDPIEHRLVFSFFILFVWILVTLILPLIRTYTSLPMLINRYFIIILPAVLVISAISLTYINNNIVRYGILSAIVIFSLTDIVIVKKYYKSVNKTQFREVSQFIIENNSAHDPVVTSLSWYFPYFLNNEKIKTTIIDKPLQIYVNEMMKDSTKRKPFWYVDAHIRPYSIDEVSKNYLDDNFDVEKETNLYDAWTKHYVRSSISAFDISSYKPLNARNGDNINFSFDKLEVSSKTVVASGWAYLTDQDATNSKITIVAISNGMAFKIHSLKIKRTDVSTYFKSPFDLQNSGFSAKVNIALLPAGKFQLGIYIANEKTKKQGLALSDKFFSK